MARMICASFFPATDLSRDPDSEHEHPNLGAGLLDTVQQCLERRSVTVDRTRGAGIGRKVKGPAVLYSRITTMVENLL